MGPFFRFVALLVRVGAQPGFVVVLVYLFGFLVAVVGLLGFVVGQKVGLL